MVEAVAQICITFSTGNEASIVQSYCADGPYNKLHPPLGPFSLSPLPPFSSFTNLSPLPFDGAKRTSGGNIRPISAATSAATQVAPSTTPSDNVSNIVFQISIRVSHLLILHTQLPTTPKRSDITLHVQILPSICNVCCIIIMLQISILLRTTLKCRVQPPKAFSGVFLCLPIELILLLLL